MPAAVCEGFSVGEGSPGPVAHTEQLIRLAISPRDFDETGEMALAPFMKVFEQGLSVMRDSATDDDYLEQALEILPHKPDQPHKEVFGIASASVGDVRSLQAHGGRLFAVYDQVVPRFRAPDRPPIPTHVGVFAITIPPKGPAPKGQPQPNQIKKDIAVMLYDLFIQGRISVPQFRGHLFADTNERARALGFQLAPDPAPQETS